MKATADLGLLTDGPVLKRISTHDPFAGEPLFSSAERSGTLSWMLTRVGEAGTFATFRVGDVDLFAVTQPPCVLYGRVDVDALVVSLGLADDHQSVINGIDTDMPRLAIGQRGAVLRAYWDPIRVGLQTAVSLVFPVDARTRAWARPGRHYTTVSVPAEPMSDLRRTVWKAFRMAAEAAAPLPLGVADILREDLFRAVDRAFRESRLPKLSILSGPYMDMADGIDTYLSSANGREIRSRKIALDMGVSVGTLHNVSKSINGLSLQRYLKLKRLYEARRRLLEAGPGILVKQCAIDCGFRHMGRFSAEYQAQFGETAVQTLRRAVPRRREGEI